ncbi:MAG: TOBE domain-containing protein, partial [Anaerolineaceae bacterium]
VEGSKAFSKKLMLAAGVRSADGIVSTAVGLRFVSQGAAGTVRVLLRNEGVTVMRAATEFTLNATLTSRLFQGAELRIQVATVAGTLEFALPAGIPLPEDGDPISLAVPNLQVLEEDDA